jgi:hypothetical protein
MDDVFSNIGNSTIVNRSLVENAFNAVKSGAGDDTTAGAGGEKAAREALRRQQNERRAAALLKIAEHVAQSGNKDAGHLLDQINEELSRPRRELVKRAWDEQRRRWDEQRRTQENRQNPPLSVDQLKAACRAACETRTRLLGDQRLRQPPPPSFIQIVAQQLGLPVDQLLDQLSRLPLVTDVPDVTDEGLDKFLDEHKEVLSRPQPRKSLLKQSWDNLVSLLPAVTAVPGAAELFGPFQVCMGAMMECIFGMAPSSLVVLPTNRVLTNEVPDANIMDHIPMVNIMPFAMCMSPANPEVIAATIAAFGVPTPMPCIPLTVAPWVMGAPTVLLGEMPTLNNTSQLMCIWAGEIMITDPGEETVQVPP